MPWIPKTIKQFIEERYGFSDREMIEFYEPYSSLLEEAVNDFEADPYRASWAEIQAELWKTIPEYPPRLLSTARERMRMEASKDRVPHYRKGPEVL